MNWINAPRCKRLASAALLLFGTVSVALAAGDRNPRANPGVSGSTTTQTIFPLSRFVEAVCNDGTPGVYYFRKSSTGSTRWLFYLEGGQQCHDMPSCEQNYYMDPGRTTSTGWTVTKTRQGIMSTDPAINPLFYDGNVVQVHNCSSDLWSGNKMAAVAFLPTNPDTGWSYQGRAIALAAMHDLADHDADTGFSGATDLLFAGSSAGALGITYVVNDLIPLAPPGARLLMAIDAGFALQIGTFQKNLPPTYISTDNPATDIVTAGIPWWNGHGDTRCFHYAVTFADQIACYDNSRLLTDGYITLPTLIMQYELDQAELNKHHWKSSGTMLDTPHMVYETEFTDAMVATLAATGQQTSVFAPQRIAHTMLPTNLEFTSVEQFPGYTMTPQMALSNWFYAPSPRVFMFGNGAGVP